MPSSTVENYLKQLYVAQQDAPGELVTMGRLATIMGVVPGTATSMIKALADSGLVAYEPRSGVRLTSGGEQLALHVLRRHRLVELFLVKILGLDWSEVHAEAEELEHVISDKVLQRIDECLGHPTVDPHGDPIPSARGQINRPPMYSLADCDLARPVRIARIVDQEPAFLQFVNQSGLTPGSGVVVEKRDPIAQAVTIRPQRGSTITLGSGVAAKILVEAT
ncbi:MAG TPA: metal-dependent transcriptional regulator [Tepidisphaeraceae bacterium]|nr:metal-dependent transcriptional regulator [Tepidisphaeraceae bacterium]